MPPQSKMIARSPSPPEADDGEEEWPVYGIVGEDVDVFGNSSYEVRWHDWSRPDGTNTTWMRGIDDSTLIESWETAMKEQRLRKATESQSIDLTLLASTPMHDRLTFERSEAVDEKMEERLRRDGSTKLYQGWMEEIEFMESQVARPKGGRGDKSGPTKSKQVIRIPPVSRQLLGKGLMQRVRVQLQRPLGIQNGEHERLPFFGGDDNNR